MDDDSETKEDITIREDQWKNCLGCVVVTVAVIALAFFGLVQCSKL